MKLSKMARAFPFASLLGLSPTGAKAEEDDERKQRDDESDEDYDKRMKELDEKEKDDAKKARKAEDEKDRQDAARRADEGDDDEDMKEDDEDDDEDSKRAGRAKGARQRERVRCAKIIVAGMKSGAVKQACAFAFDTRMSASEAIRALGASALDTPVRARSGLADRMAALQTPVVGPDSEVPSASDPSAIAAQIVAAGKARRGEA